MRLIDFSKINLNRNEELINPKSIFSSLKNKSSKYKGYLRDVQSDVLEKWFERRNSKNIVIKMNTGSGKTVVSLLILKSSMNENKGNAVYVVPNNYLIEQVKSEAKDLDIEIVTDVNDIKFVRKEAILVINIQKLINGRSIFGLKDRDNIKIDNIVIDDVHACLENAEQQSTISISKSVNEEIYSKLFKIFYPSLKEQNSSKVYEIQNNLNSGTMLVPFRSILNKKDEIIKILASSTEENISFSFQLIKDNIDICDFVVSSYAIEISIRCLPIYKISCFENANRRIFLTATLNDDSELIKNFNIIEQADVISPKDNGDIGNRMILFPQSINPKISDDEIKSSIKKLSEKYKTFVIVPSYKRAEFWGDVADKIYNKDNISNIKDDEGRLNILVNRYDGIDLPYDLCRILVIDGLPETRKLYDSIEETILFDVSESTKNKIQLIEQGMGRGIRSNDDYCAVLIMGHSLINLIHNKDALKFFSEPTLKQIELSNEISLQLKGASLEELISTFDYCLLQNSEWINQSISILSDLKNNGNLRVDNNILLLRKAYNFLFQKEYENAVREVDEIINSEKDDKIKGYYTYILAKIYAFIDVIKSEEILKAAKRLNNSIPIVATGLKYERRMKKTESQSKEIIGFCADSRFIDSQKYLLSSKAIIDELNFLPDTSEKFEQAICDLGKHLGFVSTRPDKELNQGPDNLWNIDDEIFFVIECKNGTNTDTISKDYCGQFLNSINWARTEYGAGKKYIPIMIHNSSVLSWQASPGKEEFRIITPEKLEQLKNNFNNFSVSFITSGNYNNPQNIERLLEINKLKSNLFISEYTVKCVIEDKKE